VYKDRKGVVNDGKCIKRLGSDVKTKARGTKKTGKG
jgi:hypothetical protein